MLAGLIRHMQALNDYRRSFERLQAAWDTLTMLGQLSGDGTEMSGTRSAFEALTASLLNQLALETRDKVMAELRTKSRDVIDVLVRNLFERTADIGFLAADTDIREMLEQGSDGAPPRSAIEQRFRAYVAKYSVYSDIILTDCTGAILGRLEGHGAARADHPLIGEALTAQGGYVETYGLIPFVSDEPALVYAWRVEGENGRPLGVLVLVFKLQDEMTGIFRNLLPDDDWTVLGCVAPDGRVIASSCGVQLPVGTLLPTSALSEQCITVKVGGRAYLAAACRRSAYQGYAGPGWIGVALLPLDMAFGADEGRGRTEIDDRVLSALTSHSTYFSEPLRAVSREAALIQRDLNRSVWNGSIRQAGSTAANAAFSKILLWEISNAGRRTQAVFDASIGDLHRTVVASILDKAHSRAAFAIDVMDRNLYERANDCRWWALNASLARALGEPTTESARLCAEILARINGLYTVYSNLILFDRSGCVIAVSQPEQAGLVGLRLEQEWVQRTLALRSGQDYAVSAFEPTPLYQGADTLIYTAAIHAPGAGARAIGGIAIVFDATPQFRAILSDALPRDERGAPLPDACLMFVSQDRRIMASSDPAYRIGAQCPFAIDLEALEREGGLTSIVTHQGQHLALGAARSRGYREYKVQDGHAVDTFALCIVSLGQASRVEKPERGLPEPRAASIRRADETAARYEVATFQIGSHWLGVGARDVIEAVEIEGLKPSATQAQDGLLAGYKLHVGAPVPVLRLARLLGLPDLESSDQQIVIVRSQGRSLGLVVDQLGPIPEIAASDLQPLRDLTTRSDVPALGVFATRDAKGAPAGMLMLLDTERLGARLPGAEAAVPRRAVA